MISYRGALHRNPVGKGWCLPFLGSDLSVMRRSQYYFHEVKKMRPVQFQCYVTFPSLLIAAGVTLVAAVFFLLSKFSFGRSLLLKVRAQVCKEDQELKWSLSVPDAVLMRIHQSRGSHRGDSPEHSVWDHFPRRRLGWEAGWGNWPAHLSSRHHAHHKGKC